MILRPSTIRISGSSYNWLKLLSQEMSKKAGRAVTAPELIDDLIQEEMKRRKEDEQKN